VKAILAGIAAVLIEVLVGSAYVLWTERKELTSMLDNGMGVIVSPVWHIPTTLGLTLVVFAAGCLWQWHRSS
jgi:hypothetical protein